MSEPGKTSENDTGKEPISTVTVKEAAPKDVEVELDFHQKYPEAGGRLPLPPTYIKFAYLALILNPVLGMVSICLSWASHAMSDEFDEECNKIARRLGKASLIVGIIGIIASVITVIVVLALLL